MPMVVAAQVTVDSRALVDVRRVVLETAVEAVVVQEADFH